MSERVITIEMACDQAGTHDPHDPKFDYVCPSCNSGNNAATNAWECEVCKDVVERFRGQGDVQCQCGANYNAGGQRLRDDYRGNPSMWDDEIGDMEGFEMQHGEEYY